MKNKIQFSDKHMLECHNYTEQRHQDDISVFNFVSFVKIFVNFVLRRRFFKHKGHKDLHKVHKEKTSAYWRSAV